MCLRDRQEADWFFSHVDAGRRQHRKQEVCISLYITPSAPHHKLLHALCKDSRVFPQTFVLRRRSSVLKHSTRKPLHQLYLSASPCFVFVKLKMSPRLRREANERDDFLSTSLKIPYKYSVVCTCTLPCTTCAVSAC